MRTRTVIGERPVQAPAGWTIFNAPRPIRGAVEWQDDFCSGIFYTAHDPQAEDYAKIHELNHRLDAVVLTYISEEEAYERGRASTLAHYAGKKREDTQAILDDPENRSWIISRYLESVCHDT